MQLTVPELPADKADALDLGVVLGRTQALGLVAGRCTAAQAAGIRRLRNEKLYLACCARWDEFCPKYLHISRAEADRTIRLLDQHGPTYFEVAQLIRISPETYRAIAPYIKDGALQVNGEAIELCVDNAKQVAAAVTEFRRALPAPAKKTPQQRIEDLDERARQMVAEFEDLSETDRHSGDWTLYGVALTRTSSALRRLELQTDLL